MAVTYTESLQPQFHRLLVTFTDSFGATSRLYVHASQAANKQALIDARVATMTTNESNMTALMQAAAPAPAAASTPAPAATPAPSK